MEALAKSVQQAQAAVLAVQDDLALLGAHAETTEQPAAVCCRAADDSAASCVNPYYVELQTSVQQRQEAAAQLLQRCAHLFYEQFGVLEERAARLENVREKEKELQSAKKSMQRYFDAHAAELAQERDTHAGAMRLERERQAHLEDAALILFQQRRDRQQAHGVVLTWMKKAMIRNLTREYTQRRDAARATYESLTCDALVQQQRVTTAQRALCTWRVRLHRRRCSRLAATATEAETRAHFFRNELATTQQALHERLEHDVCERDRIAATAVGHDAECAQHEDEVQRLRAALRDMTVEFSERTRTYVRQQESLEQLFARKEAALRETVCGLQATLTEERQAHARHVKAAGDFIDHVNACWAARVEQLAEAVRRTEAYAHYTVLGLTGRQQHRLRAVQQEAAALGHDVHALAPLSERCVRLESSLAEAAQALQRGKTASQSWERQCRTAQVVASLLTDRVAAADSAALRARFFVRWLGRHHGGAVLAFHRDSGSLTDAMHTQRRTLLLQQQEQAARHTAEAVQLRDELDQLRRENARLQAELETAARTQRERDAAHYSSEARNGELSAALLREKMERRGLADKWWSSRAAALALQEAQQRLRLEGQEAQWWSALVRREGLVLKVWAASLHGDTAQLSAVCETWQTHCAQLEAAHAAGEKQAAARAAAALERGVLQAGTLSVFAGWRAWAQRRRAVAAAAEQAAEVRRDMLDRHGRELTRLHASHDTALQRQQRELADEKTQLQAIHQERCAAMRRAHGEELRALAEKHTRQLALVQAAHSSAVAQRVEEAGAVQAQLDEVGALVVEYCAQAAFQRWRAWAAERQRQRTARQQRGLQLRGAEWHAGQLARIGECASAKADLWATTAARLTRDHAADMQRHVQRLEQEQEVRQSQLLKLQAAKEGAESASAHLRGELQHTRALYEAETHYTERLQREVVAERAVHRSRATLADRAGQWQETAQRVLLAQLEAVTAHFSASVERLMAATAAAVRAEHDASLEREEALTQALGRCATAAAAAVAERDAAEAAKDAAAAAAALARARSSDGDSVLDVSGWAPEEKLEEFGLTRADSRHVSDGAFEVALCSAKSSHTTAPELPVLVPVVSDDILERLAAMSAYVWSAMEPLEARERVEGAVGGDEMDAACRACEELLTQPFLDAPATAPAAELVAVEDVPQTVRALLEVVRLAAQRSAAARDRQRRAELTALEQRRAQSETALEELRESMGGLLAEQRSLAAEIHESAEQQRDPSVPRAAASAQTSLVWTETWEERLTALSSRYARVLDAFYDDITRRQETFYSVNGILVEVDEFSEGLLQRFADNVSEMARLQRQLLGDAAVTAWAQSAAGSAEGEGEAAVARAESPDPAAPPPFPASPALSPVLPEVLAADGPRTPSSSRESTPAALSARSSVTTGSERCALRKRVHLLEKTLVEAKVQLAEAKSLASAAQRAASLASASAQAHVWAAEDAAELRDFGVTEAQLLLLYGAAEPATRTLTAALRSCAAQMRGTQAEMTQQLRTACVAVEASLQARHRADLARYEAKLQSLNEALAEAARGQARDEARLATLEQEHQAELAGWAERYARDTALIRKSCQAEADELVEQQRLLEAELQRCRRATQASVHEAVTRQAELLSLEHAEQQRRSERVISRLTTERALLAERLLAAEEDGERRVQQERAAVVRLQHQLAHNDVGTPAAAALAGATPPDLVLPACVPHLLRIVRLHEDCVADKVALFSACAAELVEGEREQWETELLHLRERVALLLDAASCEAAGPALPCRTIAGSSQERTVAATPCESGDDVVERTPTHKSQEDSLQALTASPSPRRSRRNDSAAAAAPHTPQRPSRARASVRAARSAGASAARGHTSPSITPTRRCSPSVESLELSQSILRYSKLLSDQRMRNEGRLERASALAAEVDDLLLRAAQLSRAASPPTAR